MAESVSDFPPSLTYRPDENVGTIAGSATYYKDIRVYSYTQPGTPSTAWSYQIPAGKVVVGHRSFISVDAICEVNNGSGIPTTANTELAEQADSVLFSSIKLTLNGRTFNELSSNAHLIRDHYDIWNTTTADRAAGVYEFRRLRSDEHYNKSSISTTDDYFVKDAILNKNVFTLIRPLDDLPFFGKGDSYLPPTTVVGIVAEVRSQLGTVFHSTVASEPRFLIQSVTLNLALEDIETNTSNYLIGRMNDTGLIMKTTIRQIAPLVSITPGARYSQNPFKLESKPDFLAFCMYPQSTFTPANSWQGASIHSKTLANVDSIMLQENGVTIRKFENCDYRGLLDMIREANLEGPIIKGSDFIRNGMGEAVFRLHSEKDKPHDRILAPSYNIEVKFNAPGATENLNLFYYYEVKRSFRLKGDGVTYFI